MTPAAIQPQANPVNTFISPGQGMQLGGPVSVPRPPDPQAPNGDMEALAKSLGSFNQTLGVIGETFTEYRKQQEAAAKARGEQLAASLATRGYTNYGEAVKDIERRSVNDPSLVPLLMELRASDPRPRIYAEDKLQELALQQSMASAQEIIKNTPKLPDGRDMRLVPPTDRGFQEYVASVTVPVGTSPGVLARNSTALMQVYGTIRNEQVKQAAGTNDEIVRSGFTNGVAGSLTQLQGGVIDKEQLILQLTDGMDQLYANTRPSLYADVAKKLPDILRAGLQAIEDPGERLRLAGILADEVLPNIPTGPRLPNGTRARLIDTLEGEMTTRDFFMKATQEVLADRNLNQDVRSAGAEDAADAAVAQMFTPEVMSDPARLGQTIEGIPQLAEQLYPNDVVAQNAFRDRALKAANGKRGVYSEPLQEKTFAELLHQQAMNPNANLMELVPQYKTLYDNKQLSLPQYSQLTGNARSAAREDAQGAMQQVRQNTAAYKKRLDEMDMGPGGTLDIAKEAENIKQAAQFYQQQMDHVKANPGRDVTQELAGRYRQAIEPMIEEKKQEYRKPLNQSSGQVVGRYKLNKNSNEDNRRLVQDAQSRVMLPPDVTRQQVRGLLSGDRNALDSNTKRMLLRLKQLGIPASQYYLYQLKNMGDTVSPQMQQKLREMDGSNLLSSTSTSTSPEVAYASTGRYGSMASNLINTIQQGALNVLAPPAQARGIDPFMGSPVVATGGMGGLLGMIRSGEGGWTSVNRGVAGDSRPLRNLTSLPIGVVEDMQQRGRLFAVGAYQFTPGVLTRARKEAGLSPNALMTPENQNRMGMALILGSKRPALAKYIRGESDDLNAAHLAIASEWAALQGPSGRGVYDGDKGGNMASIPAAQVRASLQEARRAYLSGRR